MKRWWKKKLAEWRSDVIPYADPLTAGRHPFQVFLLILCFISGLTQIIGSEPPESVEKNLPLWMVAAWSWMLVGGALITLLGVYSPRKYYDTGLTMERAGLGFTGAAAIIYGGVILATAGLLGAVAGGITVGFGFACWARARGIGKLFKRALDPNPPHVQTEEESQ